MDYFGKEVLTNTDLLTILERNGPFVYIEKVLDIWIQLMKNGAKNKSVAFLILVSVFIIVDLLLFCSKYTSHVPVVQLIDLFDLLYIWI